MTGIRIYNTLTRRKDLLEPREPGRVGLYVCGPTVYDHAHLGHARVYVFFDVLVRFLEQQGLEVNYVRNVTDLDDKIIDRAARTGQSCDEVATAFSDTFREDMEALNVRPPTVEPRATEHIPEMIDLIGQLMDTGVAYRVDGDVYFSIEKFKRYGLLSGRDLAQMQAGARVEVDERLEHPHDFALWKGSRPGEPSWDSPWGPGRPGWHIECSAMSARYLGADFDIHGGGLDLIFPHHENEIAQFEAATGERFCRLFVHNGFVNVNKEKMAKSKGNFFLIRQVLEHAHPESVRLFLLGTHYRGPIDLVVEMERDGEVASFPQVAEAQKRTEYYYETLEKLSEIASRKRAPRVPDGVEEAVRELEDRFVESLRDDLNTARAVGQLNDTMRTANDMMDRGEGLSKKQRASAAARMQRALEGFGEVLGLMRSTPEEFLMADRGRKLARLGIAEEEIESRVALRQKARSEKDWATADAIRDELAAMGVELRDSGGETRWVVRGS